MGELADRLHRCGMGAFDGTHPLGVAFRPKRLDEQREYAGGLLTKWIGDHADRTTEMGRGVEGSWFATLREGGKVIDQEVALDPLAATEELLCRWCVRQGVNLNGSPWRPPEPESQPTPEPPSPAEMWERITLLEARVASLESRLAITQEEGS